MTGRAWKPRTGQPILELVAWVATEPDGGEGIVAHEIVLDGRRMMVALVGADRERIESYRAYAKTVGRETNAKIRLVRFSTRTVLEEKP